MMGIPGYMGIGFAGGAVAGMAVIGGITGNRHVPELVGVGAITGTAGAIAGLATGLLARRGMGGVAAALAGTAIAGTIPVGILAASRYMHDTGAGGDWGDLAAAAAAGVLGIGVAGGGVALLGHALLRH